MTAVFGTDLITAYLLLMGLLTMLVATLLWQQHRTQRTIAVWLAAAILGVLLGSVGSFAALRLSKNHVASDYVASTASSATNTPASPSSEGSGSGSRDGQRHGQRHGWWHGSVA